jgi:hypothetical protein
MLNRTDVLMKGPVKFLIKGLYRNINSVTKGN